MSMVEMAEILKRLEYYGGGITRIENSLDKTFLGHPEYIRTDKTRGALVDINGAGRVFLVGAYTERYSPDSRIKLTVDDTVYTCITPDTNSGGAGSFKCGYHSILPANTLSVLKVPVSWDFGPWHGDGISESWLIGSNEVSSYTFLYSIDPLEFKHHLKIEIDYNYKVTTHILYELFD